MNLARPIAHFTEHGYAPLGPVLTESAAAELANRAHELMTGDHPYPGLFYQHDSPTGRYEDLQFNAGWVGPSTRYRKLERLEHDPLFADFIENDLFAQIAGSLLGDNVLLYRSVLWNKAPGGSMATPWHQDDGKFWGLDRPPVLQIWTALDDAPTDSGCLEVIPGSHKAGLASSEGGTLTDATLERAGAENATVTLPARRGEGILVHNHTWHRTGHNDTSAPRRAVSISLLSGDTRCTRRRREPRQFRRMFCGVPHPEG